MWVWVAAVLAWAAETTARLRDLEAARRLLAAPPVLVLALVCPDVGRIDGRIEREGRGPRP